LHIFFAEIAGVVIKVGAIVGDYLRKETDLNLALKIIDRVAVNEDALFVDVSVKVQTKFDVIILNHLEQKLFDSVYLWLFELIWIGVASIEVFSSCVSSEITFSNTVRVYDWNYVKDKFLQKHSGLL
jgi:hypothetical protein